MDFEVCYKGILCVTNRHGLADHVLHKIHIHIYINQSINDFNGIAADLLD